MSFKEFLKNFLGDDSIQNLELPDEFKNSLGNIDSMESTAKKRANSAVDYDETKKSKNLFKVSQNSISSERTTKNLSKEKNDERSLD